MVILLSVTAGESSTFVWRDEETKISGRIHKKNITYIFDGKQQRNAMILKSFENYVCLAFHDHVTVLITI